MHLSNHDRVRAMRWREAGLEVLDQRLLPDRTEYRLCTSADDVAQAITTMQVRGAPAIGIAAAYGVVLAARRRYRQDSLNWRRHIQADLDRLARSRPTAVNLFWALERMQRLFDRIDGDPYPPLLAEAESIHQEDIRANRTMGRLGAEIVGRPDGVLTHCNTGSLATGGFGTALGVIRTLWQRHPGFSVFATETRPWNQGARLTLWELEQDEIPATLIADHTAAFLFRRGRVQWVVVGADRIAVNGDVANKIGTYALAVAARRHGVKLMVVAPTSTIDWHTPDGEAIPIEERAPAELLPAYYQRKNSLVTAWNPVFDITPTQLIDVIVTEKGAVRRPDTEKLIELRD